MDLLPAMVFLHAPDGDLETVSERFLTYSGLSAPVVTGLGWTAVVHPDDLRPLRDRWRSSLAGEVPFEAELRVRRANGDYRWFLVRTVPEHGYQGGLVRWLGIWTDIDAQKRAERGLHSFKADLERRIEDRNLELEEAVHELEGFSYTVAHDLRAPLRAIHSLGQILQEDYQGVLDSRGKDFVARITEACGRMDLLVNDLLSYSRLSRQELPLHPIELETVVDQALRDLSAEAKASRSEVRVERPLPVAFGNSVALPMAVRNLLSNALKYVPEGVSPRVTVRAEDRDGRVRLWVEDNGIGIPPEYHERIFRVFERLHPPEVYSGTGIGLAIVRRAIERMSGQTGLESTPGQGSRFWIELPRGVLTDRKTARKAAPKS
jgi:PAS domain S-box-containing protein